MSERQPVFFLSHGAPPLADDATWTRQLHDWSARVDKPRSVLMVSAHWENQPVTVSSTRAGTPLVCDSWGFPQKYYDVTDAPVSPELASRGAAEVPLRERCHTAPQAEQPASRRHRTEERHGRHP